MPLDSIVADGGGVAGREVFRNATLALERRKLFDAAFLEGYPKAAVAQMSDPPISTGTAPILDDTDALVALGKGGSCRNCGQPGDSG